MDTLFCLVAQEDRLSRKSAMRKYIGNLQNLQLRKKFDLITQCAPLFTSLKLTVYQLRLEMICLLIPNTDQNLTSP